MEKKQTAVEWLLGEVSRLNDENYDLDFGIPEDITIKAKEMEKEQICSAVKYGCSDWGGAKDVENYYNKTYGI